MAVGHRLYGDGPEGVVVLIGWLGDHTVFEPMLDALDASRNTYLFVDCRGYGLSRGYQGPFTMLRYAQDALEAADELGWESFHVVGHSMGGNAVQRLLTLARERIQSLVAMTPVPASGVPMEGEQLALFEGAADEPANRRAIIDFTTGSRLGDAWLDRMVERSLQACERDAFAAYLQSWSKDSFVEEVNGASTPMKVLVGEHDHALTPEVMHATFLEWYPQAELEVLPNAGHFPMAEIPIHLATVIDRFVAAHTQALA